jgi:hypothetical protein
MVFRTVRRGIIARALNAVADVHARASVAPAWSAHRTAGGFAMVRALVMLMFSCACLASCATHREPLVAEGGHVPSDAAWQRMDSDGDGSLSRAEIEQQHAVALQEDLPRADANGDGRVSQAEFDAWWPAMTHTPAPASLQALNQSSAR